MQDQELEGSSGQALWSDDPADQDFLSFAAIADTAVDALIQPGLTPVAIGLSGTWGSGKTTVLNLIAARLQTDELKPSTIVVRTDPWRYDPTLGARESLIGEVLSAIGQRLEGEEPIKQAALKVVKDLARRVNWSQAIRVAARSAITLQLPTPDALDKLLRDDPEKEETRGLAAFHESFKSLMSDDALSQVTNVAVLVDDLDRCLPETVVETLEAIRLFLSVPKMSFVLAADEHRVAEAIRLHLGIRNSAGVHSAESIEGLYLHKIVQTTIAMPALSKFDTSAYLFLLLCQQRADLAGDLKALVAQCEQLRREGAGIEGIVNPEGHDLAVELEAATTLTPILYRELAGNPRYIKRFMNDLWVRQSIAGRRGIVLGQPAIAKLMVLEKLYPVDFTEVLDWLGSDRLTDKFTLLQTRAPEEADDGLTDDAPDGISHTIRRWNSLPPSLSAEELTGYLTLAAAFVGKSLVDPALPQLLQQLADSLLSTSQVDRQGVKDEDLAALPNGDAVELVNYVGQRMRTDPAKQFAAVRGMLRVVKMHPETLPPMQEALSSLPAGRLEAPTALLLRGAEFHEFLEAHRIGDGGPLDKAIDTAVSGKEA